ncbi:MAG TPA: 30S ribosomal protein S21 [Gemmatimonadales bacterium]|nr:30S ribosomal protein S21 [Gemmatimonadales bacterium]
MACSSGADPKGARPSATSSRRAGQMVEIMVTEGEGLDRALKLFKRKVVRSGLFAELRRRRHYMKPSEARQRKAAAARRRKRRSR